MSADVAPNSTKMFRIGCSTIGSSGRASFEENCFLSSKVVHDEPKKASNVWRARQKIPGEVHREERSIEEEEGAERFSEGEIEGWKASSEGSQWDQTGISIEVHRHSRATATGARSRAHPGNVALTRPHLRIYLFLRTSSFACDVVPQLTNSPSSTHWKHGCRMTTSTAGYHPCNHFSILVRHTLPWKVLATIAQRCTVSRPSWRVSTRRTLSCHSFRWSVNASFRWWRTWTTIFVSDQYRYWNYSCIKRTHRCYWPITPFRFSRVCCNSWWKQVDRNGNSLVPLIPPQSAIRVAMLDYWIALHS